MTVNDVNDWRVQVARKRQQLDSQIPSSWRLDDAFIASALTSGNLLEADIPRRSGILSQDELDITERYSARQLLRRLADGEVTSLAVTTAFCKRAAIAQQLTSCLTEHFFDRAVARAVYLDEFLGREGKPLGPLHGLPISIKDTFCVQGVQTTLGYVSFLGNPPAEASSALVKMLLDLGAVLYVKTNIPQTLMTADSENNVFGRTLNPGNTKLTAGGSSGGEGALVAFRGSILGVGTDIAGSVRIPALCNGVYGFKPTAGRVPFGGQITGAVHGLPGLVPCAGPLAHSLDDMALFISTVLDARPDRYDAAAHAGPWQRSLDASPPAKVTIGIVSEDEHFPLHPPVRRALASAVDALTRAGHSIVRLANSPDRSISYGSRLAFQYFNYAPRVVDHIAAGREPPVASVAHRYHPMFSGPPPVSQDLETFDKMAALHTARDKYQDAWRQAWVDNDIDVFLGPAAQNTAVAHDTYGWPPYTLLWNLLDYPACVIPYGRASKALDPEPMSVKDHVQPSYDPDVVDGAPCAIQITAPRYLDEKCLALAAIIERDLTSQS